MHITIDKFYNKVYLNTDEDFINDLIEMNEKIKCDQELDSEYEMSSLLKRAHGLGLSIHDLSVISSLSECEISDLLDI